jgi:hypothetical protein
MKQVVSFKQRVLTELIHGASLYKMVFMDYDYLIYSPDFSLEPYYIIQAINGNYLHLTGVNTPLSAYDFFKSCLDATLADTDFDFIKPIKSEDSVKGSVRRKINLLPNLTSFFSRALYAEEEFANNRIQCSFATADNALTMGFDNKNGAKPKTLLKGNVLNKNKMISVSLVLRRNKGLK